MSGPLIVCAVIVESETEDGAAALGRPLIERSGLSLQRLRWEPHPKTGPHSKLWIWLRLEEGATGQDVKAAIDGICTSLVEGGDITGTPHNHAEGDDGSFSYERILDGRKVKIIDPGVLWIHAEALYAP